MKDSAHLDLPAQTIGTAGPRGDELLAGAKRQLGFVPNMYANMANAPGVLETYLTGYRLFREAGGFSPVEQEVVFLTISRANGCTYCMAAHSMIADKASKVPPEVLRAIREEQPIGAPKLKALSDFTRVMVDSRGMPPSDALEAFRAAGYTDRHALDIVLAIAVKTLSNYSNHLFATEVDPQFAGYRWPSS